MPAKATAISMDEYLRTSYEWEPEWVDGELVERALPNKDRAKIQQRLSLALGVAGASARLFTLPGLRVPVSGSRWRIPDISIFADREPEGDYPSNLYSAIEILLPQDALRELTDKLDEYAAMGIRYIWVVDPGHKRIQRYENESLIRVEAIEFPERAFRLPAAELFA